ncbi:hypothetical protein M3Y98_00882900 [Aphelenchoides besseyi]|nr:hypothetical protein M3Y98_00882900 [Aphelenchoides besseyi]
MTPTKTRKLAFCVGIGVSIAVVYLLFFCSKPVEVISQTNNELFTYSSTKLSSATRKVPTVPTKEPTLFLPLTVKRTPENRKEIAIVVIIANNKTIHEYVLPLATLRCYAQAHGYLLLEINLEREPEYVKACPNKDFMFQRHCVMANLMKKSPEIEWFAFLDADIGVVNPNHLIEEFTHPAADLIFYNRLYNYEITSGAYLAKNTEFARLFLGHWGSYEYKVKPGTLHGTDNGAISVTSASQFASTVTFAGSLSRLLLCHLCSRATGGMHENLAQLPLASNYDDLFRYESCARGILGPAEWFRNGNGTIRQLAHGRGYWSRDGWQTGSKWSDEDFMFHGWKENKRNGEWKSMFTVEDFNPALCKDPSTVHLSFAYKPAFHADVAEIRKRLLKVGYKSYEEHLKRLQDIIHIQLKKAGI